MGGAEKRSDFWQSSGYRLLRARPDTGLEPTHDFLRAFLNRPELAPVEDSCTAEHALHQDLLDEPAQNVPDARLATLADPDARENYAVFFAFRDRLLDAGTLERAYLELIQDGAPRVPSLFLDHLVHALVRHILRDVRDPIRLRAAELLFREQKVTLEAGQILLADEETVEMHARRRDAPSLAGLLIEPDRGPRTVELDVLDEHNAALWWARSDRFDTVLDLGFARPGQDGLCRVLEAWVAHFTGASVSIQPVQRIDDTRWVWHVGLDVEASGILNTLWDQGEIDRDRLERLLALFRLEFRDPIDMLERVRGRPVYLALAMSEANRVRLKPQNLLVNLPLARAI